MLIYIHYILVYTPASICLDFCVMCNVNGTRTFKSLQFRFLNINLDKPFCRRDHQVLLQLLLRLPQVRPQLIGRFLPLLQLNHQQQHQHLCKCALIICKLER